VTAADYPQAIEECQRFTRRAGFLTDLDVVDTDALDPTLAIGEMVSTAEEAARAEAQWSVGGVRRRRRQPQRTPRDVGALVLER
jgi:hypothetical protein